MGCVRIAAVSYLNTIPFVYGIKHADIDLRAELLLDIPAICAENILKGKADVALIPAAEVPKIENAEIVTDYCIASDGVVRTVTLLSNVPVRQVRRIWLDSHSRTSVQLVRILAAEYWKIAPEWKAIEDFAAIDIASETDGYLLIGDKVFDYEDKFRYNTDLAAAWKSYTSLPFVFAVWVAKNKVDREVINRLNTVLAFGVAHKEDAVKESRYSGKFQDSLKYLTENIKFTFDADKRKALILFLQKIAAVAENASPG